MTLVNRILLVDDNRDMRQMLKVALEIEGYFVLEAANGREALEMQRRQPSRVLVTDIFMPDADGFEAIDSFRKEFPETKIVVISGDARVAKRDYLDAARLIGADATLPKPFEPEALIRALRAL
jgi:CheY-like chemotaxis protein